MLRAPFVGCEVIEQHDYNVLAEKAIQGQTEVLPILAESVYDSLRSYVFRITLSEDLTDDIVQETILEMYKIFGQLRNGDRFWPWLCKIALNKIRMQSRTQTRQKHLLQQHAEQLAAKPANLEGLANVIHDEIKQTVFEAVLTLNDQQKAVLSMRCYENMPYSQIAQVMGMSELGVRILFFRTKNKLQKLLFNSGFGKKSLVMALVLFGKMTASSEASAAQVCITSSTLSVGAAAATLGALTTKTVLLLTTASVVTVGVVAHESLNGNHAAQSLSNPSSSIVAKDSGRMLSPYTDMEGYYYYPQGSSGPVMMRLSVSKESETYQALQNDTGNYLFDNTHSSAVIRNARYWNPDLSVMQLPADSPELETFIAAIEHRSPVLRRPYAASKAFLIVASRTEDKQDTTFTLQNYDALMEERFHYNWSSQSAVQDQRDAIHRQGWCYFTMTGYYKDQRITGQGQMPFYYGISQTKPAWLAVRIGNQTELYDSAGGALKKNSSGIMTAYGPNALFAGLNKPWMGLHCIDSIRRDAATADISFQTQLLADTAASKVTLLLKERKIEYLLNMEQDWIEKITFLDASGNACGEIVFAYIQTRPAVGDISMPTILPSAQTPIKQPVNWLVNLASESL